MLLRREDAATDSAVSVGVAAMSEAAVVVTAVVVDVVMVLVRAAADRAEEMALPRADSATLATS